MLELGDHGARQSFQFLVVAQVFLERFGVSLEEVLVVRELGDTRALPAFDQNLHRSVGQLEQLQHGPDGADRIDISRAGVVLGRILLRHEKDLLVVLHHVFQSAHGFVAPDEERHDHVGKHHDVAERKNRVQITARNIQHQTFSPV